MFRPYDDDDNDDSLINSYPNLNPSQLSLISCYPHLESYRESCKNCPSLFRLFWKHEHPWGIYPQFFASWAIFRAVPNEAKEYG